MVVSRKGCGKRGTPLNCHRYFSMICQDRAHSISSRHGTRDHTVQSVHGNGNHRSALLQHSLSLCVKLSETSLSVGVTHDHNHSGNPEFQIRPTHTLTDATMDNSTTSRQLVAQQGQYAVTEITTPEDMHETTMSHELVVRGHTALRLKEVPQNHSRKHLATQPIGSTSNSESDTPTEIEPVSLVFDGSRAVSDIGVELLRASHVIIPLEGIIFAEDVTHTTYRQSRRIENPLNDTPGYNHSVTYPKKPAQPTN